MRVCVYACMSVCVYMCVFEYVRVLHSFLGFATSIAAAHRDINPMVCLWVLHIGGDAFFQRDNNPLTSHYLPACLVLVLAVLRYVVLCSSLLLCKEDQIQDTSASAVCYFESYIKGLVHANTALNTAFRTDVHEAYRDYDINVNRIMQSNEQGSAPPYLISFTFGLCLVCSYCRIGA